MADVVQQLDPKISRVTSFLFPSLIKLNNRINRVSTLYKNSVLRSYLIGLTSKLTASQVTPADPSHTHRSALRSYLELRFRGRRVKMLDKRFLPLRLARSAYFHHISGTKSVGKKGPFSLEKQDDDCFRSDI